MIFWRSAETLRDTSGEMPKARQIEKSNGLEGTKLAGVKAEKEQVFKINMTLYFYSCCVLVSSDGVTCTLSLSLIILV